MDTPTYLCSRSVTLWSADSLDSANSGCNQIDRFRLLFSLLPNHLLLTFPMITPIL
nr:MAG TPA: hypothetical protein [Bacteriophage sp.]